MKIEKGTRSHGFVATACEEITEIEGFAYTFAHEKSGAKLLYLANNDSNKAFSISFKTPPEDNSGVFHILEHSVLCGSRKFPVKEPFVNLIKSSMQTFLNAMTFPDKTMYPVASTNEKDLLNLMDVYLDAVFNPLIYEKREIFEQEAWHYELDNTEEEPQQAEGPEERAEGPEEDGTSRKLTYNGVVFNEMKGALSDPSAVLWNTISAALFPDTCYRFESGGDPQAIPDLSYRDFLDVHERHYRKDNSYLFLYGDLEIEDFLEFLDREYLGTEDLSEADTEEAATNGDKTVERKNPGKPNPLALQDPVISPENRTAMQCSPDNACGALAFVAGTSRDRERAVAIGILLDAICGSNEAPLKRSILDSGLAGDFHAYYIDSLLQPVVLFQTENIKPESMTAFREKLLQAIETLCKKGVGREKLEASLSRAEFIMRERDFGIADGVMLAMQSMAGWLYDDTADGSTVESAVESAATAYLRYEDVFDDLRGKIETDYFEKLLQELVLESEHWAGAEVIPAEREDRGPEARLAQAQAEMSAEELAAIPEEVERLRSLQEQEDSAEDLAKLPLLLIEDLTEARPEAALQVLDELPLPCLYHELPTRGIDYLSYYFDANRLSFGDLPYLSILCMLLGKLETDRFSAEELDTLLQCHLGSLHFFTELSEPDCAVEPLDLRLVVGTSALEHKLEHLCKLPAHVLRNTTFTDSTKIHDILVQRRIRLEQAFISNGHSLAMARSACYYSKAAQVRDVMSGVSFYFFLKDLLANFDYRVDELQTKLRDIHKRLLTAPQITASFTGSTENRDRFWDLYATVDPLSGSSGEFSEGFSDRSSNGSLGGPTSVSQVEEGLIFPEFFAKNEAFVIPSDVCYVAKGYDRRLTGLPYSGSLQVAGRAISLDYLWNEVRVKGGAYGAGLNISRTGNLCFYSYRDPHLDETLRRFDEAGEWLRKFEPDEAALRGYLISSAAGHDAPKKPHEVARTQDRAYFCGWAKDYREQTRAEILATTAEKLRSLKKLFDELRAEDHFCVIGARELLQASKKDLQLVELIV